MKNSSSLYKKIIDSSSLVDKKFSLLQKDVLKNYEVVYPVPAWHIRYQRFSSYPMRVSGFNSIKDRVKHRTAIWLFDKNVVNLPFVEQERKELKKNKDNLVYEIFPKEEETKEYLFLSGFIRRNSLDKLSGAIIVVGVGGGILYNMAGFIAESLRTDLYFAATTAIAMADVCGGKVRANLVSHGQRVKHYYKSFYEPNLIISDPRFLETLPKYHIKSGLAEFIKQGLFQSQELLSYLLSPQFDPFTDKESLMKVVLWAADLKRICLEHDPEEKPDGARIILRGGHDISDRLEEKLKFQIPHGFAVAIGIVKQLTEEKNPLLGKAIKAFKKFGIPVSEREWNKIKKI